MPAVVVAGATSTNNATTLWQSIVPDVAASSEEDEYYAYNAIDPATWSSWLATASNANIRYDFQSSTAIDGVGISAHNLSTSGVTSIYIESSSNDSSWTTVATYSPLTDDDLFFLLPSSSARYWRLRIAGPPANIGVLVMGKRLIFPHSPIDSYTPLHHARKYTKLFNDSVKGQFLGNRVMAAGAETSVDMGFFDRSWLEANIRPFEYHYNQGGTFFYAGCPGKYPLDSGYCRAGSVDDTLAIEWSEADKMATLSFGIRAYVG